jgi:FkbM family methyltransferase
MAFLTRRKKSPEGGARADDAFKVGSYSQCGEDLIVSYVFALRGITQPSYLDIGAHHPFYLNNTALFYFRGGSGVNIEPNPELIECLRQERPRDTNVNVGISAKAGRQTFYCMDDPALSTFSEGEVASLLAHGKKVQASIEVPAISIRTALDDYCAGAFPDFLSIDVEGSELEIFSAIDFSQTWPKVICVETAEYSPTGAGAKRRDLMALIESRGYLLYADTNLNSIYVKQQFWLSRET